MLCTSSSASWWWLRSANNNNNFNNVNSDGSNNNNNANNSGGVVLSSSLVRQSNLKVKSVWEGEKEGMTLAYSCVNITPDRFGRTILAWRCLMMMCRFMPGNLMLLNVIIRQQYGGN